jgi:hypothetical protein
MILSDTFPSSSSDKVYTAQYNTETGKGTCNCPGWTKRSVRECTHTKQLAIGVDKRPVVLPADPFKGFRDKPAVKPMLASAMKEGQSLDDFTSPLWVMEEKYDGHRLIVTVTGGIVSAWTRPGHERDAAQRELPALLTQEFAKLPNGIYDGELYLPGGTSSDVVRLDRQNDLVFVLFDVLSLRGEDVTGQPLWRRRDALELAWRHADNRALLRLAAQEPVMLTMIKDIWKRGGEGAILKRSDSTYRCGYRSPDWIKVKQIDAAEFVITGFEEGKNGPCSVFLLRHDDGRETSCKVLTNELLKCVHKDPQSYIGRRVTISHMGFTKSGLWRHPVFDHFTHPFLG